jgi:hypothetical protein
MGVIVKETLKDLLQNDFCEYYHYVHGIIYDWKSKDNTHLGSLIGKIRVQTRGKLNSELMRNEVREYFKYCFHKAPQWYRDNMEVSMLNSKFNVLWKLYKRLENDPQAYDRDNQAVNYRNGNKKANPMHKNTEPSSINDLITQFTTTAE